MKKWQRKEMQKKKGERDYEALINEDLYYKKKQRRDDKGKTMRDRHRGAVTKRIVVIERDEE